MRSGNLCNRTAIQVGGVGGSVNSCVPAQNFPPLLVLLVLQGSGMGDGGMDGGCVGGGGGGGRQGRWCSWVLD